MKSCLLFLAAALFPAVSWAASFAEVIAQVQPRLVKIVGSGGLQGLEAYQSGFLISADGHVLTVWSYVLDDPEFITVTLDDGRKFQGANKVKFVGADPRLEIAVLKLDATDLPHFTLDEAVELSTGSRVLAFSNLYNVAAGNEAASVLHGSVQAKWNLDARRGAFKTAYAGTVYVVDAMTNNPGAAGGVLTDRQGRLAGLLGKELRNSQSNVWLNYAVPIKQLASSIEDILAGKSQPRSSESTVRRPDKPLTLPLLGLVLVPDVLPKTPPYIDYVRPGSPAERAGLKADDLILFVNDRVAASIKTLTDELSLIDRIDPVRLVIQRKQALIDVELKAK